MEDILNKLMSDVVISRFITTTIVVIALLVVLRLIKRAVSSYVKENETRYRTLKFVTFVGYLIILVTISFIFSDRLGRLSVALGVAGAGIAFALQEVIASTAGWLAIAAGNFYTTGDRVQLGGIMGDVIDIGILRTTIMECGQWVNADLYNGRVVKVANSFVFKEPVFNYSGDFPFLWDEIKVPVKYGSDFKLAKVTFKNIAEEVTGQYYADAAIAWGEMVMQYMIEEAKLEPVVFMTCNDNWIEYAIRYVVDYKKRRSTKDQLFTRIMEEVEASENRIMLASATFHLVEAPVFNVRLQGADGSVQS